jgi:OOP family OmpA-OmpF porin
MKFKKFTLLFACLLGASAVQAQDLEEFKHSSIGLDLGFNKSYTDLTQYPLFPTFKDKADVQPSIGLHYRKSLSAVFGLQLNVGYDRLQGVLRTAGGDSDSKALARTRRLNTWFGSPNSVYFQTPVFHFGLDAHINISNIDVHYRDNGHRKFLYYALVGADVAFYNPELLTLANDAAITEFENTRTHKINQENSYTVLIRAGAGVRYNLNSSIDLGFEFTNNFATTDLLEGLDVKSNGNDMFLTGRFLVNYKLPSKSAGKEANLIDWRNPGQEILADIEALNARIDSVASVLDNALATADSDGDGVYDSKDKEPYTPFGAKVDADGKGIDTDGDGVYDGLDKQNNTPSGTLVNFQGIEIKMPEATGGSVAPTTGGTKMGTEAYFPSLFFDTGSTRVRAYDVDKLVRVATALQQNAGLKVKLVGHADVRGGTEFNEGLAKKRAEAVRDYLINNLGVDASRITMESKGESSPLSPSMNDVNRRVDIMGI